MKSIALVVALTYSFSFSGFSQDFQADSAEIVRIIQDVFDGMRESDTSKMAPYMHPDVRMQSLNVSENGNNVTQLNGASGWLNAVAQNTGQVWNEEVSNIRILSDGSVATAWMEYKFYLGNELSHCGINSFQFIKIDENWKIIYIIDSRNKNNCQ
ncbi:Putative lumazine-binding [Marivirga sericea]|uniref:Putative lumazine-binding n=1 Tax=Marivirga sericea TaxID=1028 RepID=A0A1X7J8T6_9BACT|nr:nuclear transport factor 2 family protein [Marivirga sericea]SMG24231.1 Putative lumazine-binding [Marivirga sericea]